MHNIGHNNWLLLNDTHNRAVNFLYLILHTVVDWSLWQSTDHIGRVPQLIQKDSIRYFRCNGRLTNYTNRLMAIQFDFSDLTWWFSLELMGVIENRRYSLCSSPKDIRNSKIAPNPRFSSSFSTIKHCFMIINQNLM